jgi:CotH kinase protein/Lamin Tail Domain/Right handed beta helix region/Dockerin type I domain
MGRHRLNIACNDAIRLSNKFSLWVHRASCSFVIFITLLFFLHIFINSSEARELAVVISEIMYHPAEDGDQSEYVELANLGPGRVDISGWSFDGAITYLFSAGTKLEDGSRMVVARDVAFISGMYGINNVVGSYGGRLDNGGEVLYLRNASGQLIDQVDYNDDEPWPKTADGLGSSLELPPGESENHLAQFWKASLAPGGTPGKVNSVRVANEQFEIIPMGALWRYFKGVSEPDASWKQIVFPGESSWLVGNAGFGYEDGDDNTILDDMEDNYRSVYIRADFQIVSGAHFKNLILQIDYDDGFVAYLNGQEVARGNIDGAPGSFVGYTSGTITGHEAGAAEFFDLSDYKHLMLPGKNVLAIQGHNETIGGSDFSLHPRLYNFSQSNIAHPQLTEVASASGALDGYIELYNPTSGNISLSGYSLRNQVRGADLFTFTAADSIAPGAFFTIDAASLPVVLESTGGIWCLLNEYGELADSLHAPPDMGMVSVRSPYKDSETFYQWTRTRGETNRIVLPFPVPVINEIHYHPADSTFETEFLELHNPHTSDISLSGWSLSGGVDYAFPSNAILHADDYLVVAGVPALLFGQIPTEKLLGPYSGKLNNQFERVVLRDSYGNMVDSVFYSQESGFPQEADGGGPSLELINSLLDNGAPAAWLASATMPTPATANSRYDSVPLPVVFDVSHYPLIPTSQDNISVSARVTPLKAGSQASLIYRGISTASYSMILMRDDGQEGDMLADDGVYMATMPLFANNTIVEFYVSAQIDGQVGTYPLVAPASRCLALVQDSNPPDSLPKCRILMTDANRNTLESRSVQSNVLLDCTLILDDEVRYMAGVRYRGHSARSRRPRSYRVDLTGDLPLHEVRKLNFNAYHPDQQLLGSDFFRRANLPGPWERFVRVCINDDDAILYSQVERLDSQFLERIFPSDSEGTLYRGASRATLTYLGESATSYTRYYIKQNNEDDPDYSDIINLTRAFSIKDATDFANEIATVIDVNQWLRWFAAKAMLNDEEGGIFMDNGDDYYLYQRPSDGLFVIVAWDFDSVMQNSSGTVYRPSLQNIRRLLRSEAFSARYLRHIRDLSATFMEPVEMASRISRYRSWIASDRLQILDEFATERLGDVHGQVVRNLTAFPPRIGIAQDSIIREGDSWRFFRGTVEPSSGSTEWATLVFDDSIWEEGISGFGYGDGDDNTLLSDMEDNYVSVYVRKLFWLDTVDNVKGLVLRISYDDGFVAYLNGNEVARSGLSGTPPPYDQRASSHEAGNPEDFDLGQHMSGLQIGWNVLAVQGHNTSIGSSDFSLIPELMVESEAASVLLTGFAPMFDTRFVKVNGADAVYDAWLGRWSYQAILASGSSNFNIVALDENDAVIETLDVVVDGSEELTALIGDVTQNTTWTIAESPYLLDGVIEVDASAALTIEPGVEVRLGPDACLWIKGNMRAEGTSAAPIRFGPSQGPAAWGCLAFENAVGDNRLSHCIVSLGNDATLSELLREAAVSALDCSLVVQDCTFENNQADAIDTVRCDLVVRDSYFIGNHGGIHCNEASALVENNVLLHTMGDNDAIDFNQYPAGGYIIRGNVIIDGGDDGIDSEDAAGQVSENLVAGFVDSGISLEDEGPYELHNNLIYDCNVGFNLKDGLVAHMLYNTVVNNRAAGLHLEAKDSSSGAYIELINSVVWDNGKVFEIESDSSAVVSYSLVDGGAIGPGNINLDPQFMDAAASDFRLAPGSPLISMATGSNVLIDLLGNVRLPGFGNSLGACQYDGIPVSPTPTPTLTSTPTPTLTASYTPTATATPSPTATWTATPTSIFPDYNEDGIVDGSDLLMLMEGIELGELQYDLNGDGRVSQEDLLLFSMYWYEYREGQ